MDLQHTLVNALGLHFTISDPMLIVGRFDLYTNVSYTFPLAYTILGEIVRSNTVAGFMSLLGLCHLFYLYSSLR